MFTTPLAMWEHVPLAGALMRLATSETTSALPAAERNVFRETRAPAQPSYLAFGVPGSDDVMSSQRLFLVFVSLCQICEQEYKF